MIQIIQNIVSEHREIKLEISNKKYFWEMLKYVDINDFLIKTNS